MVDDSSSAKNVATVPMNAGPQELGPFFSFLGGLTGRLDKLEGTVATKGDSESLAQLTARVDDLANVSKSLVEAQLVELMNRVNGLESTLSCKVEELLAHVAKLESDRDQSAKELERKMGQRVGKSVDVLLGKFDAVDQGCKERMHAFERRIGETANTAAGKVGVEQFEQLCKYSKTLEDTIATKVDRPLFDEKLLLQGKEFVQKQEQTLIALKQETAGRLDGLASALTARADLHERHIDQVKKDLGQHIDVSTTATSELRNAHCQELQQLKDIVSKKADATCLKHLDELKDLVSNKADLTLVDKCAQDLRIEVTKLDLTQRQSIAELRDLVADKIDLKSLTKTSDRIHALEDVVEKHVEDIKAEMSKKANGKDIEHLDELKDTVSNKADLNLVNQCAQDLRMEISKKVDATHLNCIDELMSRVAKKADSKLLEQVSHRTSALEDVMLSFDKLNISACLDDLKASISSKVDPAFVDQQVQDVRTEVAKKADVTHQHVMRVIEEFKELVASKADLQLLEALADVVTSKADLQRLQEVSDVVATKGDAKLLEQVYDRTVELETALENKVDMPLLRAHSSEITSNQEQSLQDLKAQLSHKVDVTEHLALKDFLASKVDRTVFDEMLVAHRTELLEKQETKVEELRQDISAVSTKASLTSESTMAAKIDADQRIDALSSTFLERYETQCRSLYELKGIVDQEVQGSIAKVAQKAEIAQLLRMESSFAQEFASIKQDLKEKIGCAEMDVVRSNMTKQVSELQSAMAHKADMQQTLKLTQQISGAINMANAAKHAALKNDENSKGSWSQQLAQTEQAIQQAFQEKLLELTNTARDELNTREHDLKMHVEQIRGKLHSDIVAVQQVLQVKDASWSSKLAMQKDAIVEQTGLVVASCHRELKCHFDAQIADLEQSTRQVLDDDSVKAPCDIQQTKHAEDAGEQHAPDVRAEASKRADAAKIQHDDKVDHTDSNEALFESALKLFDNSVKDAGGQHAQDVSAEVSKKADAAKSQLVDEVKGCDSNEAALKLVDRCAKDDVKQHTQDVRADVTAKVDVPEEPGLKGKTKRNASQRLGHVPSKSRSKVGRKTNVGSKPLNNETKSQKNNTEAAKIQDVNIFEALGANKADLKLTDQCAKDAGEQQVQHARAEVSKNAGAAKIQHVDEAKDFNSNKPNLKLVDQSTKDWEEQKIEHVLFAQPLYPKDPQQALCATPLLKRKRTSGARTPSRGPSATPRPITEAAGAESSATFHAVTPSRGRSPAPFTPPPLAKNSRRGCE